MVKQASHTAEVHMQQHSFPRDLLTGSLHNPESMKQHCALQVLKAALRHLVLNSRNHLKTPASSKTDIHYVMWLTTQGVSFLITTLSEPTTYSMDNTTRS